MNKRLEDALTQIRRIVRRRTIGGGGVAVRVSRCTEAGCLAFAGASGGNRTPVVREEALCDRRRGSRHVRPPELDEDRVRSALACRSSGHSDYIAADDRRRLPASFDASNIRSVVCASCRIRDGPAEDRMSEVTVLSLPCHRVLACDRCGRTTRAGSTRAGRRRPPACAAMHFSSDEWKATTRSRLGA